MRTLIAKSRLQEKQDQIKNFKAQLEQLSEDISMMRRMWMASISDVREFESINRELNIAIMRREKLKKDLRLLTPIRKD